jgi:hypothetical protein
MAPGELCVNILDVKYKGWSGKVFADSVLERRHMVANKNKHTTRSGHRVRRSCFLGGCVVKLRMEIGKTSYCRRRNLWTKVGFDPFRLWLSDQRVAAEVKVTKQQDNTLSAEPYEQKKNWLVCIMWETLQSSKDKKHMASSTMLVFQRRFFYQF